MHAHFIVMQFKELRLKESELTEMMHNQEAEIRRLRDELGRQLQEAEAKVRRHSTIV